MVLTPWPLPVVHRQGNRRQPAAVGAGGAGITAVEQTGELALVMSDEGAQRDSPDDGSSIVCNRSGLASLAFRMDSTWIGLQARKEAVRSADNPTSLPFLRIPDDLRSDARGAG
jgi:hypothetical protein